MKSIFVVLPLSVKKYLEVASKLAFAASMKLGEYLKLLPDERLGYSFALYDGEGANMELEFVHGAISWMTIADYVMFVPDWERYKECKILHTIAETYGLSIVELDDVEEVRLKDCPFCGVDPLPNVMQDPKEEGGLYYVRCEICGGQGARGRNEQEAKKLWNKRDGD